jgi:ABC-type dipeptide/oligopeptide/nickel transport system ATPase component
MGCIVGREGSGKSHTALKIASGVDPSFTADRVFFDPKRLLEVLKSDEYGSGTAVVIDEAGVGLGNRTWYDKDQILLNQALQTARDDNMCVLFTLPRLSELDSQTIGRLHTYIEMMELNKVEGYATARWMNIDPARDESGEIYKKYPRLREKGRKKRIERVSFTPPAEDLVEHYEERKAEFKQELYAEAIEAAEEADNDGDGPNPKDIAQEIAEEGIGSYVARNGSTKEPYINKDLIRVEHDLSHSDASAVKTLLERSFDKNTLEKAI